MKKALGLYLAASLTAGTALSQNAPGGAEPTLQAGIKQFGEGDLAGAVFTLEAVIRTLALEPTLHTKELSQAYLYRGAAFVGLSQEEHAKGSFAAALQYDKGLRIGEDKFSPRVVRVFEAARTGKTKSVLLPPSNVAKKAGLSGLGIGLIVAGVAAAGGGIAAATAGKSTPPPATPTVGSGAVQISFDTSEPPPGSTITGCGASNKGCPAINLGLKLRTSSDASNLSLSVFLNNPSSTCLRADRASISLKANQLTPVGVQLTGAGPGLNVCQTPFSTNALNVSLETSPVTVSGESFQAFSLSYNFAP